MTKPAINVTIKTDDETLRRFHEELSKFFNHVFECEKRRLGINFRYPKLAVQVVFVVTIIALMLVLM